ncbi:MAG: methyltransferase domain-containing protein [Verrucomicrobiales bacterium]|nr:methyltransferase domain-containing protein [Verrucomicrobiales bacterium]
MDQVVIDNLKVGAYWSTAEESGSFSPSVYWLANPLVQKRFRKKAVGGRNYNSWPGFCVDVYLKSLSPVERVLSVGCGSGQLERDLAHMIPIDQIDAIDVAPGMIEEAQRRAEQEGLEMINYLLGNVEEGGFPGHGYHAIFFNMSLHHMFAMDETLQKTAEAINADGFLFLNEYVGPNRFAFTEREKEVISSLHALIPDRFRYSLADHNRGFPQSSVVFPDPLEVARVDPSESVCSAEILPNLEKHFDIIELNQTGGTVLQFLLHNIAGHFRKEDPESLKVLDFLFKAEDLLIEIGELDSHFVTVVAKKKV